MKKLFSLFSALLVAGSMLADNVKVALASGVYETDHITWTEANGNIKMTQLKGTSGTAVNANYIAAPRVYKGHVLCFEALNDYVIDSVKITCSGSYYGNSMVAGVAISDNAVTASEDVECDFKYASGGVHTLRSASAEGLSVIYLQNVSSASNVQLRPTAIDIYYTKPAVTNPTIEAGGYNFKSIPSTATDLGATISVEGFNLTEAITYSLMNNNIFAVSGELTNEGGELSVTVTPSEAGVFVDTIVLSSTSAVKKVVLEAKVIAVVGQGTQETPFTVSDIRALNNEYAVSAWVSGVVYGIYSNNKPTATVGTTKTNMALVNGSDTIPVQLVGGSDAQAALNLVDNADLVGKTVKVYGSLEAYFSAPAVKNVSEYEIVSESTAINALDAEEQKVLKVMIDGQMFILRDGNIYTVSGQMIR